MNNSFLEHGLSAIVSATSVYAVVALAAFCASGSTYAATTSWLCEYVSGTILFKDLAPMRVTRSTNSVVIGTIDKRRRDDWTYRVVASDQHLGFRAVRVGANYPKQSSLDILLGGEVFMLHDSGKTVVFATAVNAASQETQSTTYSCVYTR